MKGYKSNEAADFVQKLINNYLRRDIPKHWF